jgi:hypothetical protein
MVDLIESKYHRRGGMPSSSRQKSSTTAKVWINTIFSYGQCKCAFLSTEWLLMRRRRRQSPHLHISRSQPRENMLSLAFGSSGWASINASLISMPQPGPAGTS